MKNLWRKLFPEKTRERALKDQGVFIKWTTHGWSVMYNKRYVSRSAFGLRRDPSPATAFPSYEKASLYAMEFVRHLNGQPPRKILMMYSLSIPFPLP